MSNTVKHTPLPYRMIMQIREISKEEWERIQWINKRNPDWRVEQVYPTDAEMEQIRAEAIAEFNQLESK